MVVHTRGRALILGCATLFVNPAAVAQSYPVKAIRMIVPFPAGGGTDLFARSIGEKMSSALRQQVAIDNRSGAGGMIGSAVVAHAAPDGYTLMITSSSTISIGPHLIGKPLYDPLQDFAPVINIASAPYVLAIHPSLPVHSVGGLIKLAKARPGELNFASSGYGTLMHLTGELLKQYAGVNMVHVPYKGGPPAVNDLAAGNVSLLFVAFPSMAPLMSSGKLRVLAVTSAKRVTTEKAPMVLKALPAMAETLPGFDATQWWGMFAPAGTPSSEVNRLNVETAKIIIEPEIMARFAAEAAEPVGGTPQEFATFLKADYEKWGNLIKSIGIRLQ